MSRDPFVRKLKSAAWSAAVLVPLAGCGTTDRIVKTSVPIDDYRARHPIVIAEDRTSIDVFPSIAEGKLDGHTAKQIFAFAQQYRELGRGPILVLMPNGHGSSDGAAVAAGIRRVLMAGGARSGIQMSSYPVADDRFGSPVRVSYVGLKAKVADQCGQWPSDLGSGGSVEGWENKPYWNFGCSTQSMIAAQTSDPRDLVSPRGEEPADTLIRSRAIDSVRKGADPNTTWAVKNSNIGSVGGS